MVEVHIKSWYPAWLVRYKTRRAIERDRYLNSPEGQLNAVCKEFQKSMWRALWKG